jgi:AcrR family transcriptional regulator
MTEKLPDAEPATRKQEIQRLAAEMFAERGYDAISVRDLATAAGITVPTLYWYIGNKEQLLLDLFQSIQQQLWDRLSAIRDSDLPADEKIRAVIREQFDVLTTQRSHALVTFREGHRVDPELRDSVAPTRRDIDRIVRDILISGRDEGLWGDEMPLDTANLAIWSVIQYAPQWFRPEGRKPGRQMADEFADLILNGLRSRPPGGATTPK